MDSIIDFGSVDEGSNPSTSANKTFDEKFSY